MNLLRLSTLLCAVACTLAHATAGPTVVYLSEGGEKRIGLYTFDEKTGGLTRTGAVELVGGPGSLALSPSRSHLYAAVRSDKQVATLAINPRTGALDAPTYAKAGLNAAYLSTDRTGKWLLLADYGEGMAGVMRIADGVVADEAAKTVGTGKKAHCIQIDPANRFAFVPHAGELSKVEQLRFDAATGALTANDPPALAGEAGPRHMQFHPNGRWVYLVNEQGQSVSLCDFDAQSGTLKLRQTVSTTPPDWDKSKGSCADIHVTADGRFVYASNRGHDSLATFAVNEANGELQPRGQTPTEKTPRSFCLVPGDGYVISAGQGSARLVVYRRDAQSGALTPLETYACGKSPAWITAVKF